MNTLKSVRSMVTTAAIAAIIVVMASVPFLGYIPLGFMNATIIHVPVIIGAILLGRNTERSLDSCLESPV